MRHDRNRFKHQPWIKVASLRRGLLLLIVCPTLVAAGYMAALLPHGGTAPLELAIVLVFSALFAWISLGFWTAMLGFAVLWRGVDRFAISRAADGRRPLPEAARTAILMPVYNENAAEVLARLRASYESLKATGQLDRFDFFLLSDSDDPDCWVQEEAAWADFRAQTGFERLYYRRRRNRIKRKSGNVADWCRRWGCSYRYMVVLDADSLMSGPTLVRMVGIMERRRDVGILQTAPRCVNRESLIARVQQFANRLYGPMFAAGLHFWQLGDAQFWGHNAIIRVRPFIDHCALPRLPGRAPLGGEILSHDFVEAAHMRRAGYGVWLAFDLGGSYEEVPPSLLDELKRDRRWCQGNLQHLRLLFTAGLFPAHRALFLNGAMAYGSALLWFLLLALSTVHAILEAIVLPTYFSGQASLFPQWPVWYRQWGLSLLAATGVMLFLPKLAAVILLMRQGRARRFGGLLRLVASVLAEVLLSALLAPVRMLFHSRFVFVTLLGGQIGWGSQNRADQATGWTEALRFHGAGSLLALLWGTLIHLVNPGFFWWLSPILVALLLAPVLSVWSSRVGAGRGARRLGLFLTPEETRPPAELRALHQHLREAPSTPPCGLTAVVLDPRLHRLHVALLRGPRRLAPTLAARRDGLRRKALHRGLRALSVDEKKELLMDADGLRALHLAAWSDPGSDVGRAAAQT